ncbi:MAG: hypothetical protein KC777_08835 [Cyanobacteria bacterium HKST-UBA02]|nr:hypothetical protein [Cyanobacteria bacterium HKST-UBA02]
MRKPILIAISVLFFALPALSASPESKQTEYEQSIKDLRVMENRFFFHDYEHDPLTKRVERLECLVFGSAQYGVPEERIERLRATIAKRDRASAEKVAAENAPESDKTDKTEKSAEDGSRSDYPILTTLEWRVLKKTYRGETMDERLGRLETSLFGQPSTAMSYLDRIERLKKVAGIGLPGRSLSDLPEGPLPRAGSSGIQMRPFTGIAPPGSSSIQRDYNAQFNRDFAQMFKYMNQQMRDMFRNGQPVPGSPVIIMPEGKKQKLPSYADPNSI